MNSNVLIESFAEFARSKNIDRPTMMSILEDVFRTMIRKKYTDDGNFDVILNVDKVKLTGCKEEQKVYHRHSGYPGGLREDRAKVVRAGNPLRLMESAVRGMLPKSKLGDAMYRKLKVYASDKHPHAAQQPTVFEVA